MRKNITDGGFGSSIIEFSSKLNSKIKKADIKNFGLPSSFSKKYGTQDELLKFYDLHDDFLCKKMYSLYKMINYRSSVSNQYSDKFKNKGYLILKTKNNNSLKYLQKKILQTIVKECKIKAPKDLLNEEFLNNFHKKIKYSDLNEHRVNIIRKINQDQNFKKKTIFCLQKKYSTLVGNELSMQNRINLSIQFPNDASSLLPLHSDIWSGDSPFEVVVWIPLVDCYGTKAMYILPPNHYKKVENNFKKYSNKSSNQLFNKIKKNLEWIDIKFGEILVFNQALPHGNIVNKEKETRWSMNCRLKVFFLHMVIKNWRIL